MHWKNPEQRHGSKDLGDIAHCSDVVGRLHLPVIAVLQIFDRGLVGCEEVDMESEEVCYYDAEHASQ